MCFVAHAEGVIVMGKFFIRKILYSVSYITDQSIYMTKYWMKNYKSKFDIMFIIL